MDISPATLAQWILKGGAVGILTLITIAWLKGMLITRRELDAADKRTEEMKRERDEWRNAALRSLGNNERAQGTIEKATALVDHVVQSSTRSGS